MTPADWINLGITVLTGGGLLLIGSQRRRLRLLGFAACLAASPLWFALLEWPGQWGPWAVTAACIAAYARGAWSNWRGLEPMDEERLRLRLAAVEKRARRLQTRLEMSRRLNLRWRMLLAEAKKEGK